MQEYDGFMLTRRFVFASVVGSNIPYLKGYGKNGCLVAMDLLFLHHKKGNLS